MKKRIRIVLGVLGIFCLLVVGAVVAGEHRRFDAPYPAVRASADPAVIARGSYLVTGPAHCSACHGNPDWHGEGEPPLSGGMHFDLPLGTVNVPNITPDPDTGIGRISDEALARILRHDVHPDGHVVLPFMRFHDVSDDDLSAILSYLRSRPPVRHAVASHQINPLGHFVRGLLLRPRSPSQPPPAHVEVAASPEYGRYLTQVANCVACHTKIDMRTGALTGPLFAGGNVLPGHLKPGSLYAPPNLTPAPVTGRITQWTEDTFVARFHLGTGAEGSPMPWRHFSHMSDDDLRAIFRYLRSLPPVENDTGDSVRSPGEPIVVSQGE